MSGPIHLPEDDDAASNAGSHDGANVDNADGENADGVDTATSKGPSLLSRLYARSRDVLLSTRAELLVRAAVVPVAIASSALLGQEWGRIPWDVGYAACFLFPWFAVLVNAAHLAFEPLLSGLLDTLDVPDEQAALLEETARSPEDESLKRLAAREQAQLAAARRFRRRCAAVAFWADVFVAVALFCAATVAAAYAPNMYRCSPLCYEPHRFCQGRPRTVAGAVMLYAILVVIFAINTGAVRQISRVRIHFSLADDRGRGSRGPWA